MACKVVFFSADNIVFSTRVVSCSNLRTFPSICLPFFRQGYFRAWVSFYRVLFQILIEFIQNLNKFFKIKLICFILWFRSFEMPDLHREATPCLKERWGEIQSLKLSGLERVCKWKVNEQFKKFFILYKYTFSI